MVEIQAIENHVFVKSDFKKYTLKRNWKSKIQVTEL